MKKLIAVVAGFGAAIGFAQSAYAGGSVDSLRMNSASGWACTPSSTNWQGNVTVVRDDGVLLAVGPANNPREAAVGALCGGNSAHGFSFNWPVQIGNPAWLDHQNHYVHVYFSNPDGSTFEVPGSPGYMCFGPTVSPSVTC